MATAVCSYCDEPFQRRASKLNTKSGKVYCSKQHRSDAIKKRLTKRCPKCGVTQSREHFSPCRTKADGLQSWCKACTKECNNARYADTSSGRRQSVRTAEDQARKRNQEFVWQYLDEHPCIHCGETDIVVLEFHHISQSSKEFSIANISNKGVGLSTLQKEMEKCVVLCANCHKRETASQLKWKKAKRS